MKTTPPIHTLLTALFVLIMLSSSAQNLSVSLGSGYHLGVGKQNVTHHDFYSFVNWNPWAWEKIDVSLGEGLLIDGSVQYQLGENFGFDIATSYLIGAQHTSSITKGNTTYKRQFDGQMLRLGPGFRCIVHKEKLDFYTRLGMVLGMGHINYQQENNSNGTINRIAYRYEGGISIGASAAFGIRYPLNERLSIYGEFRFVSQSYAPKKGTLTERISNGVDITEDITYNTEIDFVDELTMDPTIVVDPDTPFKQPQYSYPVNGYGLNLGLTVTLWSK